MRYTRLTVPIVQIILLIALICAALFSGCKLGTAAVYVESYGTDAAALRAALAATTGDVIVGSGITIDLEGETVNLEGTNRRLYGEGDAAIKHGTLCFGDYAVCRNFNVENLILTGVGNVDTVIDMDADTWGNCAYECGIKNCVIRGCIRVRNSVMFTLDGVKAQNEDPNGYAIYAEAEAQSGGPGYINALTLINSRFLGRVYLDLYGSFNATACIFEGGVNPIMEIVHAGGCNVSGGHFETTAEGVSCVIARRWVYGLTLQGIPMAIDGCTTPHMILEGKSAVVSGCIMVNACDDANPEIVLTATSQFCDILANFAGYGWLPKVQNLGTYNQIRRAI